MMLDDLVGQDAWNYGAEKHELLGLSDIYWDIYIRIYILGYYIYILGKCRAPPRTSRSSTKELATSTRRA